MRAKFISGVLCVALGAAFAYGGGAAKEAPFEEASFDAVRRLLGDWSATVDTRSGWHGTLSGHVKVQRTGPEGAIFHAFLELRYRLTHDNKRKPVIVSGAEEIALVPYEKGRYRYLQCLRDFQVMQREQYAEVLEVRPEDKEALRGQAALRPSVHNTAHYRVSDTRWIVTVSPGLLAMLPKQAPKGPAIDWPAEIVWQRVKK